MLVDEVRNDSIQFQSHPYSCVEVLVLEENSIFVIDRWMISMSIAESTGFPPNGRGRAKTDIFRTTRLMRQSFIALWSVRSH